ncbi:sodium- and chloride-dependent neutral and basic amino acid transporter B(0+)-like isoform X4 [Scyliorhinus canicula]|uniref:sodium- and chloride-dependent neutral and basic amino acid transporter B(0+)-like isoform X4 n=1 Tax=Scyliorhinus canicula TaxID=7830 RepID=UPI0018F32899|nr:sodium- and chloride-dependent neutral and basic amino acid transporter B(0+)-like isoform X4 [Scyliorhinus canicula]
MGRRECVLSVFSQNDHPEDTSVKNGHVVEGDENVERGNWSSKTDYLLSVVGCAVGLGNVWRFPYLAYKNGGGVFLIPYTLMLALVGIPMFFLESSFGQFASLGPIAVWKAVPMLQDPLCNLTLDDGCFEIVNTTWLHVNNETCPNGSEIYVPHQGPSEQYWDKVALNRSHSVDETGEVVWYLALCLLLTWLIIGAALSKGIKSSGKVVYFTATFPYVVLTILLIKGLTLEGAYKGIDFYIGSQSDLSKLADAEVWKDAAIQIFYSTSISWGGLLTLSSYNKFHNNCYTDTIVVCVVNCATSVFSGFAIFSVLGHMAHVQDKPISEVVQSGFGLAFIAYPETLAQLPWAPLWSALFFFMLVTLGLSTLFAGFEAIITTLLDQFPTFLRPKRLYLIMGVWFSLYILGLECVTQAGIYWIKLIDHFCAGWGILIAALLEVTGLSWIYGVNRFIKDIEMMIGERNWLFWLWWRACWVFISPCLLAVILFSSLATFTPPTYGSVEYPIWSTALGWCMMIFCIMWIPIVAIVKVIQAEGSTLCQKISAACTSAPDWGPYLKEHRGERYRNKPDAAEDSNCMQRLTMSEM